MNKPVSLTIVIAAFNEEAALPALHPRISAVLDSLGLASRILYVDDGSRDGTWEVLQALAARIRVCHLLRLSRNFGKELALTAGLDLVDADAALVLDADGQDPPELIPAFVGMARRLRCRLWHPHHARWRNWLKQVTAKAFYRVMNQLSTVIPADTGDFRLMSRRVLDALRKLARTATVHEGIVRLGRLSAGLDRLPARAADRRRQQVQLLAPVEFCAGWHHRLFHGAVARGDLPGSGDGIVRLRVRRLDHRQDLLWGDPVQGWPTMMAVVLFLGGVQLMALGVIGEYLGRIYLEAKHRPLYWCRTGARPRTGPMPAA